VQTLAGYDRDVEETNDEQQVSANRFNWLGTMLVVPSAHLLSKTSSVGKAWAPSTGLLAAGVLAGVMAAYFHGYLRGPPLWKQQAGLGWADFALQCGLLTVATGTLYALSTSGGGGGGVKRL